MGDGRPAATVAGDGVRIPDGGPSAASKGPRERTMGAAARKVASGVTVILLSALIVFSSWSVLWQLGYDRSEHFLNTNRVPYVLTAAAVGQNLTAVLYYEDLDASDPSADRRPRIMILDGAGHQTGVPVPLEGIDFPYVGKHSLLGFYGTSAGVNLVYATPWVEDVPPVLHDLRVDPVLGAVIEDVEVAPGFNTSGFKFNTACDGDTIHVLLWREHGWSDEHPPSTAFYVRSADGGVTWERPVEVHDGIGNVSHYSITVRGGHVTILLLGVHYHLGSEDWDVTEMVQSSDGGATFGEPTVLQGASIPADTQWPAVALAQNGSLLLLVGRGWLVLPSGEAMQLEVPAEYPQYYPLPVQDPTDPLRYRADAYAVRDVETVNHRYRYYILDLNGSLLASYYLPTQRSPYEPRLWTRAVDGRPQAVVGVPVYSGGDMSRATEIQLVEQDPVTRAVKVVGKPYEVVYYHTEAERAAHSAEARRLISSAWVLFGAFLASSLVATALWRRSAPGPLSPRAVTAGLTSMLALLVLTIAASYPNMDEFTWEHTAFDIAGLFFVIEGAFLVELLSWTSARAWPVLGLRVFYGLYGMMLVTFYVGVQREWDDTTRGMGIALTFIVWVVTFALLWAAARRLAPRSGLFDHTKYATAVVKRLQVAGLLTLIMIPISIWGLVGPPLL